MKTKLVTIEVGWKLFEGPKRSQNPGTDRYDAHHPLPTEIWTVLSPRSMATSR